MVLPEKVRRGWEIGNVAIRKAKLQGIVRSYIQDTADCFPKMAVTMAFPSHKENVLVTPTWWWHLLLSLWIQLGF